jgi:hypothetical protein
MPVARREAKRKLRNAQASSNEEKNRAQATRNTKQQQSIQTSTTAHTDWKWNSKWHSSNPLFFCAFYTASEQRVSGALFRRLNPSFRIKYPCRKSE